MGNMRTGTEVGDPCIRSFSCPYFPAFGLITDQKKSEYELSLHSVCSGNSHIALSGSGKPRIHWWIWKKFLNIQVNYTFEVFLSLLVLIITSNVYSEIHKSCI